MTDTLSVRDVLSWAMPVIGFLIVYVLKGILEQIRDVKETMRDNHKAFSEALRLLEERTDKIFNELFKRLRIVELEQATAAGKRETEEEEGE